MPSALAVDTDDAAPVFPIVALLLGAVAMGISPVFVRLAEVGPFTSAFWRVFLALPILWLWTVRSERGDRGSRAVPRRFALPTVLAGCSFAADLLFWHLSLVQTTIANATFFATMAPVWVVLAGWVLFRQRVSRAVLAGLVLCVAGGGALVAQSMRADLSHVTGDLFGVVTGFFFGLYFLAVSAARQQAGAARVTLEVSLITAAVLFVAAAVREGAFLPHAASGWLALLGLSWISHAGGQGLLSVALGRLPAVFSSRVIFLEAIAAALFAWALLGEAVTPLQALGAVAIVAGIWVARPRRAAVPAAHAP